MYILDEPSRIEYEFFFCSVAEAIEKNEMPSINS
jgi:hypothetical protein